MKKRLETLFRGWLPKEPTLSKAPLKTDFQKHSQTYLMAKPLTKIGSGELRATKSLSFQAFVWTIKFAFYFFS